MNCEDFHQLIDGPGPLPPEAAEHACQCVACGAVVARNRRLIAGLAALSGEGRRMQAPPRVERALVSAFRRHHGRLDSGLHWSAPVAAAASFLLATLLFLPDVRMAPELQASHDLAVARSGEPSPVDFESAFIPLPNAAEISSGEQTDVVRVELPRSAMLALGYPVTAESAEDPVEADVMLGPDGTARAVRFLDRF